MTQQTSLLSCFLKSSNALPISITDSRYLHWVLLNLLLRQNFLIAEPYSSSTKHSPVTAIDFEFIASRTLPAMDSCRRTKFSVLDKPHDVFSCSSAIINIGHSSPIPENFDTIRCDGICRCTDKKMKITCHVNFI